MSATVSELLNSRRHGTLRTAGGSAGMSREVRRIVRLVPHARQPRHAPGDLVLVSAADWWASAEAPEKWSVARTLNSVLATRVAGVIVDFEPERSIVVTADAYATPLLCAPTSPGGDPSALEARLQQSLRTAVTLGEALEAELGSHFSDLAQAGASASMLVERLVELTVKAAAVQRADLGLALVRQPASESLPPEQLESALLDPRTPTCRDALCVLELPALNLTRLVTPARAADGTLAYVSLVARPADFSARDRIALQAVASAIGSVSVRGGEPRVAQAVPTQRAYAAIALRSPRATSSEVVGALEDWLRPLGGRIVGSREDVRALVPYSAREDTRWMRMVHDCHASLSGVLGLVSLGHATPRGEASGSGRRALIEAAEALRVGERLFGPGHLTSYIDAQLARFLLGRPDAQALRALYEQTVSKLAAEDLKRESELLTTLEVYCDSGCSVRRTAERLEVHRNTVQNRLKRIEDITAANLEDGPTRLLLQVGLVAGRLVQRQVAGAWA